MKIKSQTQINYVVKSNGIICEEKTDNSTCHIYTKRINRKKKRPMKSWLSQVVRFSPLLSIFVVYFFRYRYLWYSVLFSIFIPAIQSLLVLDFSKISPSPYLSIKFFLNLSVFVHWPICILSNECSTNKCLVKLKYVLFWAN